MSVDIATLGIKVDSSSAKTADKDLAKLTDTGKRLDQQGEKLKTTFGGLKSILGAIGIAALIREGIQLADTYKNIHGRLGLVTSGTAELALVSDKLFAVAQRTRTGFEAVSDLYSSLARSTKALGKSQADLLQVTETINQTLIISGANAASSEAALRQLGQGFASGALRGDELNSVLENTPRLAAAIAEGMGVTVGQLRKLGAEGKITGGAVFDALKSQKDAIEKEFATMPTTIGQSMVGLRNEILKFVGESDKVSGASSAIAGAVSLLAQNIDTVASAIAVFAVAMGVRFVAAMVSATMATISAQAALLGLTTRAEVAGFAIGRLIATMAGMAVLGAFSLALVGIASSLAKSQAASDYAKQSFADLKQRLDNTKTSAQAAGGEVEGVGKDALGVIPKVDRFGGRIGAAAQELYNMARAARSARVEALKLDLEKSQANERALGAQTPAGRREASRETFRALGRGDILAALNIDPLVGDVRSVLSGGRSDRENLSQLADQTNVSLDLQKRLRAAQTDPITPEEAPTVTNAPATTKDKKNKGKTERERAIEEAQRYIETLDAETAALGLSEVETKQLEAARAAAKAPTEELRQSILASADAYATQKVATDAQAAATEALNKMDADRREANERSVKNGKELLKQIETENSLRSMNAKEREVALAMQEMENQGIVKGTEGYRDYADAIIKAAEAQGQLKLDVENARDYTEAMRDLNDSIHEITNGFGELFGRAGEGFENLITTISDYGERRAEIEERIAEATERGIEGDRERERATEELKRSELSYYGDIIHSAKSFFKEKSAGFKAIEAVERAYRMFQMVSHMAELAMTIKSIALDGAKTASSVANSGTRASADGIAAVAKAIASLPFPLNIVAGAATAAFLIAMGVKMLGGGGSKGASAAMEREPLVATDYSNQDSPYSVLTAPGGPMAGSGPANDNRPSPNGPGTQSAGGVSYSFGDTNLTIEGSADEDTVKQVQQMLRSNQEETLAKARQQNSQDRVNGSNRQWIGGGG